ncbi:RNA polymerase sigma factor [candidate division KSB1 bacterium]|nr:RNA polymerase sigma factor [candidate division KSB1 bacterium]MBL7093497.1 RNA polymerase sigma factor [candidate division KSB1 bacterium]
MQNTDDYLMQQFIAGDRDGFSQIVNRHKQDIFNFILSKVKDHEHASDLAQDVFVKLFNSAGRYTAHGKFKAWLFRIAQNVCIDFYRKQKNASIISLNGEMDSVVNETTTLLERLEDESMNPMKETEYSELQTVLKLALDELPEKHQTALLLCQYHGMSYKEIADIQKCPVGTVKSRVHNALMKMKEVLKEYEIR